MDTKQLNEALSKIYDEEHQRIVFWNDPQQEFDRVVETLDLDSVKEENVPRRKCSRNR